MSRRDESNTEHYALTGCPGTGYYMNKRVYTGKLCKHTGAPNAHALLCEACKKDPEMLKKAKQHRVEIRARAQERRAKHEATINKRHAG